MSRVGWQVAEFDCKRAAAAPQPQGDAKKLKVSHRPVEAAQCGSEPTVVLHVVGSKPMDALQQLKKDLGDDPLARSAWRDKARVAAIFGSCPRSRSCLKAGVRHWIEYVSVVHGKERVEAKAFPPMLDDILGWSNTFRCLGTFSNYLGYLRSHCLAHGCEPPPTGSMAIKRAMIAIGKRQAFVSRPKLFIDKSCVANMVFAVGKGARSFVSVGTCGGPPCLLGLESMRFAMLWLVTYSFLLRLPSEVICCYFVCGTCSALLAAAGAAIKNLEA